VWWKMPGPLPMVVVERGRQQHPRDTIVALDERNEPDERDSKRDRHTSPV
jgi:hypothetical protein